MLITDPNQRSIQKHDLLRDTNQEVQKCKLISCSCCKILDNNIISHMLSSYHYSSISHTFLRPNCQIPTKTIDLLYFNSILQIIDQSGDGLKTQHIIIFCVVISCWSFFSKSWHRHSYVADSDAKTILKGSATLLKPDNTAKQQIQTMMVIFTQVDLVSKTTWIVHSQRLVKFPSDC